MTERGERSLKREKDSLTMGPSSLHVEGDTLVFRINEKASPWPSPIRGEVRVKSNVQFDERYCLDSAGRHRWRPIAPLARVDVNLTSPRMRWSGEAYCDSNDGDEPIERGIKSWQWQRGTIDGKAVVMYDVVDLCASKTSLAMQFASDGRVEALQPPPPCRLSSSKWLMPRTTRSERSASVVETLDDTPFYVRSIIDTHLFGRALTCVHESLSLKRFASPIVQGMLPFRIRRKP